MAYFATTTRAIEDFLLNPAEMNVRYAESRPLALKAQQHHENPDSNTGDKASHRPRHSLSDPLAEQLRLRGYDSDEEALSSTDSDTLSISSASSGEILEMVPTRLSIISPDQLARSRRDSIEESLYCAQAAIIMPVNYGDVPLSPRLIDIPPSPRHDGSQNIGCYKPPTPRLSKLDMTRIHQRSLRSSPRSSLEETSNASTPSTPPTSVDERSPVSSSEKVLRRKSAVTSMRHVARRDYSANADTMPDSQTLREFLDSNPITHSKPLSTAVPTTLDTPAKRKLRKFSSSFSLGRFTKRNSADSSSDELPAVPPLPKRMSSLPAPEVYRPTHCSSLLPPPQPTKMMPRGGNECAPPLVLPHCPDNGNDDDANHIASMRGFMSRAPKSYSPTGAPPRPSRKLHRRQRSLSADALLMAAT